MAGETPLSMMRPDRRAMPSRAVASAPTGAAGPRQRLWFVAAAVATVLILAGGWCALWYYAAAAADRTLAGWVEREAAAGRAYTCGSEATSGFPFSIRVRCARPAAAVYSAQPPFTVNANAVNFTAQVFHPTYLVGEVTGPLTVSTSGQPPSLVATWTLARMSVSGLPADPHSISITIERPRVGGGGANSAPAFSADDADFEARIVGGSADDHPLIDAALHFVSAAAPTIHPLLAGPMQGDVEVLVNGLKDLSTKPLAARFREIQAAGGTIQVKSFRFQRADAIVVGSGSLTVDAQGRLDGDLQVAIYGLENIMPQLGIDRLIDQGIDRLAGAQSGQGRSALDRLLPGLGGVISAGANASLVEDLKKMGQPTQIDQKPAIALPVHFSAGAVYLGMIRLGEVPALF